MFAIALAALALWFSTTAYLQVNLLDTIREETEARVAAAEVQRVAEGVQSYRRQSGAYPASLATLAATSGYHHLRTVDTDAVRYALATALDDGVWRYDRALVYARDPAVPVTDAEYLASGANRCGVGDFSVATDWCGDDQSHWWRAESRIDAVATLASQRQVLAALLQRFANYHATYGAFPGGLAVGDAAPLKQLAGYSGDASHCGGAYRWGEIPLGCDDLYGLSAAPVVVNLRSEGGMTVLYLVARTSAQTAAGRPVYATARLAVE